MMRARFYTFLFAILPRRWQDRLWNHLAARYGYFGYQRFGNGSCIVQGTKQHDSDLYEMLASRSDQSSKSSSASGSEDS